MDESRPETSNHSPQAVTGGGGDSTRPSTRMMSAVQRPASRRRFGEAMTARQRPDSRMSTLGGGVGDSQQRPMSRVARLQSAMRPGSSLRQGSALRTATATARPPSGITGGALPIHAAVNVVDRPVTQQGVSGLRTARTSYGNRRMVHDKTYFLGILHTKMSEINSEVSKLSSQIDSLAKEQSTYIAYETRVKEKAAELQELHGELTDYNILADMMASEKDKSFLEDELRSLKRENEDDSARIESVYNRRRESEKVVADLEQKIDDERNKAQRLIESLSPNLRDRYDTFQKLNIQLQSDMERLQYQLDELNSRKSELYDKVSRSELKKKAAELEEELLEAEEKRDNLSREADSQESPEEERERLLNQVKIDNAEISTLERQISETNDLIRQIQDEIQNMDQEIEENDSDRQQKFRELRKREQDMEEFMQAFDDNKAKEMDNLARIEAEILSCMEKISRNVHLAATLPEAGQTFMELREDLEFKEEEFDKARYTTEMIEYRNETLKKQLDNVRFIFVFLIKNA
ncbi:unnamed protein product [Orchesella dallaii]|uniref:Intraflagellar transport protein 74 n=1 Tax=Orchesella dallaii TaxID=48710 RepID=A0ABP1RBS8_9HEXA